MFYLIYQITNKLNGKIYYGAHQTNIKDDGYMGLESILNQPLKNMGLITLKRPFCLRLIQKKRCLIMSVTW